MKVILRKTVENLGKFGDFVKVKSGFARNYLLPFHKAVIATDKNVLFFKNQKKKILMEKNRVEVEAKFNHKKISKQKFVVKYLASENGKLFGSITAKDVVKIIFEKTGVNIAKKDVVMEGIIRNVGVFSVNVKLCTNLLATFELVVEKKVLKKS